MGFRFRRRVRIPPDLYLNVSKSGVSASIGGHGATLKISKRGRQVSHFVFSEQPAGIQSMSHATRQTRLRPTLISFDVFGTLISVRESSYSAFERILADIGAHGVDVKAFWEHWEHRNITHYWEPYRTYREICELSLEETFAHFRLTGEGRLINHYFDAFPRFFLYDDVVHTLDRLSRRYRLAVVSNIDDDLLALTPLQREFDLVCTAQRAKGYKPDGALFRYLIEHAGCAKEEILHVGQSQFTDLVGGKPLGLTIAWINRRQVALDDSVPRPDFIFADIQSLSDLVEL